VAVEVPGLSLTVLRQETRVQQGRPLLVSGRFTAFGLGIPAFIRVSLEGPSYDPQIRSFDTFASPFSGDYTVNVIAEKGGDFFVYAQAFPPPIMPTGPPFPDAILLLPPMAESTHPPLVVGQFTDGGVDFTLPDGSSQFLEAPPQQPMEFRPVISVGAPGISIALPGMGGGVPALAPFYGAPTEPGLPAAPAVPTEDISGRVEDIRLSPSEINPGQEATGVMSWRNTCLVSRSFDAVIYLIDQVGVRYGPLQLETDIFASPQVPQLTNLRLSTQGLPAGNYSVEGELYDSVSGMLVDFQIVPFLLSIREIVPGVPPIPEVPALPEVEVPEIPLPEIPTVPAAVTKPAMLGEPILNLPRELTVGDTWSGSVDLPTFSDIPYYFIAQLMLVDPAGVETLAGYVGRGFSVGETVTVPVNFDTRKLTPGSYNILLKVGGNYGIELWDFPMGILDLLELLPEMPPVPGMPELPELPSFPNRDMLEPPIVDLPTDVTLGEIWKGGIIIPTVWPADLPQVPGIPSYNFGGRIQLETLTGQRFDVARISNAFTPGQPIDIPINFDTSVLPEPGMHNVLMNLTDPQGLDLFAAPVGMLSVLPMPELPGLPGLPEPPLGEFTAIAINMGPIGVEVGGSLAVPITYTHIGLGEIAIVRASLGDLYTVGGVDHFDEVWGAETRVTVGDDLVPTPRSVTIEIPITSKFAAAGIYTVEAKVNHWVPRVLTRLQNWVEVSGPEEIIPPLPTLGRADIRNVDFTVPRGNYEVGDNVPFTMSYEYKGRAQRGQLILSLGTGAYPTFIPRVNYDPMPTDLGESSDWASHSYSGTFLLTPTLQAGQLYNTRARLEGLDEPTWETDTDWSIIRIAEAPELPASRFTDCTVRPSRQRVKVGDTVNIPVSFTHYGGEETFRVYAAIGNAGAFGFDEILHGSDDGSVPDEADRRTRTVTIPIQITRAISPGTYDVYGKVMGVISGGGAGGEIVSAPVRDVITVYEEAVVSASEFSNVRVSPGIRRGSAGVLIAFLVTFTHVGEADSEWLYGAIGNPTTFGFDEILHNRIAITVNADATPRDYQEFILIPVTSAISPGTYDFYAKLGIGVRPKAISQTYQDMVVITS